MRLFNLQRRPRRESPQSQALMFSAQNDAEYWEQLDKRRAQLKLQEDEASDLQIIGERVGDDWEQAANEYRAYSKSHPDSHHACMWIGVALQKAGDLPGSLAAYEQAAQIADTAFSIQQAELPYLSSLTSRATFYNTQNYIARVLTDMGKQEQAITLLKKRIKQAKAETWERHHYHVFGLLNLTLGDLLQKANRAQAAQVAWNEAVRWDETGLMRKYVKERLNEQKPS